MTYAVRFSVALAISVASVSMGQGLPGGPPGLAGTPSASFGHVRYELRDATVRPMRKKLVVSVDAEGKATLSYPLGPKLGATERLPSSELRTLSALVESAKVGAQNKLDFGGFSFQGGGAPAGELWTWSLQVQARSEALAGERTGNEGLPDLHAESQQVAEFMIALADRMAASAPDLGFSDVRYTFSRKHANDLVPDRVTVAVDGDWNVNLTSQGGSVSVAGRMTEAEAGLLRRAVEQAQLRKADLTPATSLAVVSPDVARTYFELSLRSDALDLEHSGPRGDWGSSVNARALAPISQQLALIMRRVLRQGMRDLAALGESTEADAQQAAGLSAGGGIVEGIDPASNK